jgi:hypothetical protein
MLAIKRRTNSPRIERKEMLRYVQRESNITFDGGVRYG